MKNRKVDLPAMANWAMENLIFIISAAVLFFRTAEVMKDFSPNVVMGYTGDGAHAAYGYLCAVLVEGLLLLAKINLPSQRDDIAWAYNVGVIALTWLVSAGAQLIDGQVVRQTLDQQPAFIQGVVNIGVPLVPSIVLLIAAGKTIVETIPDSLVSSFKGRRKMHGRVIIEPGLTQPALPDPGSRSYALMDAVLVKLKDASADDKRWIAAASRTELREKFGLSWNQAKKLQELARAGRL